MISIIITTCKEPKSLPKAIEAFLGQKLEENYEIWVVGPDEDTERIVEKFTKENPALKYLKDEGKGKPAALNLALERAGGQVLVLSDGDVWTEKGSLKYLLAPFKNPKVGAATGRPIPINLRGDLFGYWAHFLTSAAHKMRLRSKNFPCSGYFYAIRKGLIKEIPEITLSEDALITQIIRDKNYRVSYVSQARVYVKYPDNFKDWLKQKVRSAGGYTQDLGIRSQESGVKKERNFLQEVAGGISLFFTYPKNLREFWWTILLYLARIYLWLVIFIDIKVRKKKFGQVWQRVESTK